MDDALDSSELELMADAAAGDARIAIGILRHAARLAEQADAQRITPDIVQQAIPEGRQDVRQKTIEQLTAHQHTLYEILQEQGELDPATLYEAYRDRVEEPKTNRTVRNYLTKMAHYRLIHAEGENRARTYRPR